MGYLGQQELLPKQDQFLTSVHKSWSAWQATSNQEAPPKELVNKLVRLAHAGSWLAGNMLHLSGVEWDKLVGDTPYEYQSAKFQKPPVTGRLFLRDKSPWHTDLLSAEAGLNDPRCYELPLTALSYAEPGRPDTDES